MEQTSQSPDIRELARLLEPWDMRSRNRRRMDVAWRKVAARFGEKAANCIVCGGAPIWRCHVRPQEDGFGPEENLVPLCERGPISPAIGSVLEAWWAREPNQKSGTAWKEWNRMSFAQLVREKEARISCHKLLDDGFISVQAIASCSTGNLHPEIRIKALDVPMTKLDSNFGATTLRHRRLQKLKVYASSLSVGSDEWCKAHCELISTARRLSSPRAMRAALEAVSVVESAVDSAAITPRTRSWFYYEKGLTWMQRHPDPDIRQAIACLQRSIGVAGDATKSSAMSELELIHAEMLAAVSTSRSNFPDWEVRQDRALQVLSDEPDKRWTVNQRLHRAQIRLKKWQDPHGVLEELASIRDARYQMTLANGWTRFQAVHLASAEGLAYAQAEQYEEAMVALARATIVMSSGCRGKRPEGYRDIASCAAWVLKRMRGQKERARQVAALAARMVDGRSGVWRQP